MLRSKFFSAEQVEAMVRGYHNSGLEPPEVGLMAFAEKVALHAHRTTQEDIDNLRAYGFSDADILDIVLAAAARSFYSKVMDAIGLQLSPEFLQKVDGVLGKELRQALTVGRPVE